MMEGKIKACLVDIDGTLTQDRDAPQISRKHIVNNALFEVLADAMQDEGWDRDQAAAALIEQAESMVFWDYPDFIRSFKLPEDQTMRRLSDWHTEHIKVYDDGVEMVQTLHRSGMDLYIISNNPFSGCLLKLQRAGLGTLEGSSYFKGFVASNLQRGQKSSPDFWKRGVAEIGLDPSTLAMVGDHRLEDGLRAKEAGLHTVFLVNRDQTETVTSTDDAFVVRRLTEVPSLLQKVNTTFSEQLNLS